MHDVSDAELVRAMAAGDSQALDDLYQRHGSHLLAYLIGQLGQRALAEEVLQDVMLAAWQGAARFRGDSQVRTWLLGIARYRALNARRRAGDGTSLDAVRLVADDPYAWVEQQEEHGAIHTALARLTEEQRETLELIFFHELTGPDVAAVMGVAPGTVKSRLHRAKAMLRALLVREEARDAQ
jgi:RNA polymerase sigma-70 factor, ECF subfamily